MEQCPKCKNQVLNLNIHRCLPAWRCRVGSIEKIVYAGCAEEAARKYAKQYYGHAGFEQEEVVVVRDGEESRWTVRMELVPTYYATRIEEVTP